MVSQGRLARVMITLMAAMIAGALILLLLEGKPIKPMAFSLSSQAKLTSVGSVLGTEPGVPLHHWRRIEVSYRANLGELSNEHGLTGELGRDFHFVVDDGRACGDGQIFASRQWTQQRPCPSPGEIFDQGNTLRICLVGDPAMPRSTPRQAGQLEALVTSLVRHCQLEPKIAWKNL